MPGPVALVGSGEFLPAMADFDAGLLAATGRARPRVVILPTASYPDGEEVFIRWATMGVAHFGQLGAEVEPVLVRDRTGADDPAAAQAIGEADLVYLSGGKPGYLLRRAVGKRDRPGARRCTRARRRDRGLLGRRDDPRGARFRFPRTACAMAPPLASWTRVRSGHVRGAALRRLAGAAVGADRAPGAAGLVRPRHRRGDSGDRARRGMAGPRAVAGHGLAGPASRAVPSRRDVPVLSGGDRRHARSMRRPVGPEGSTGRFLPRRGGIIAPT